MEVGSEGLVTSPTMVVLAMVAGLAAGERVACRPGYVPSQVSTLLAFKPQDISHVLDQSVARESVSVREKLKLFYIHVLLVVYLTF